MSADSSSSFRDSIDSSEDELVQAVKRYMDLLEQDHAPQIENYLQQYPVIARQLRLALEGLAMVHGGNSEPAISGAAAGLSHTLGVPVSGQSSNEVPGKPIGDFQIVSELGRGGMGVVYEAIQLSLNRRVALKVLPFASGLDKVRLQRFRNEAHAAAGLHHTNIVPVYAVGSERGVHYYAMQLIEGHTLAELIERMRRARKVPLAQTDSAKPPSDSSRTQSKSTSGARNDKLSMKDLDETFRVTSSTMIRSNSSGAGYLQTAVEMIVQAAEALQHAHQYGVIHRDIKPGNLLIDQVGKVWVTDFGLAQIQHADNQLTRSGDHVGTLRYMSPEQASGDREVQDHRSDIYSLGVTLYELLTLEPAIQGENYREMLNHVAEREPAAPRLLNPAIPVDLDTVIRKSIAKEPALRYPTAKAFAEDLRRWLDNKPIAARPPTILQRISKWRKRNSLLVNTAAALMFLMSIGLLITTFLVLREQAQTKIALEREIEQRNAAEKSFAQAREAVDTFSELSESELAFRPEVQTLRKKFLETSLEFYRSFVSQRSDDPATANELTIATDKVERILGQLKLIHDSALLFLLEDSRVQTDLKIEPEAGKLMIRGVQDYRSDQSQLSSPGEHPYLASNELAMERMHQFVEEMNEKLTGSQFARLQQIAWQMDMPFTFLSDEVVQLLDLSPTQRKAISRIIGEHRPRPEMFEPFRQGRPGERNGEHFEGKRGGPDRRKSFENENHRFDDDKPRANEDMRADDFQNRPNRGPLNRNNPPFPESELSGDRRPPPEEPLVRPLGGREGPRDMARILRDPNMQRIRKETVDRILSEVLSAAQRTKWLEAIGEPFQ